MTAQGKTIGDLGENAGVKYLMDNGYKIICRNYHSRYGEIDIIAEKDDVLALVEVRTRNQLSFSLPRETVDIKKQQKIIKTAYDYLSKNESTLQPRFDVIEIIYRKGTDDILSLQHIPDAFYAG